MSAIPCCCNSQGGDAHLGKFYRTALGNPALRPLLRRTGLPELRDEPRLKRLREALIRARDDETPDWAAIGQPVAELLDTIDLQHPAPKPRPRRDRPPDRAEIEARHPHLRRASAAVVQAQRLHPDLCRLQPDRRSRMGGRELSMALTGLNSRGYKNSTLLFNLARVFIARSPAAP